MWTLHEARAKCGHGGIWRRATPAVTLHPGASRAAVEPGLAEPWLAELAPARITADAAACEPLAAALAVADGPREVSLLRWNATARSNQPVSRPRPRGRSRARSARREQTS
jgi:hypothetical protein